MKYTLATLKELAASRGVKGISKLKKAELADKLADPRAASGKDSETVKEDTTSKKEESSSKSSTPEKKAKKPSKKKEKKEKHKGPVVCMKMAKGEVVQGCDVYIGRAQSRGGWDLKKSIWANPFKEDKDGTMEEILVKYEVHVRKDADLMAKLPSLKGKILGCWCKKKGDEPCHGDVLLKLLSELK